MTLANGKTKTIKTEINLIGKNLDEATDLMLKYRCASFFARTECPNVLMGFYTAEEIDDIYGSPDEKSTTTFRIN